MTVEQTGMIMDILTAAYPRFYATTGDQNRTNAVVLWASMFQDDDVNVVTAAVKSLIASDTKGFPPHIGAVKEQVRRIMHQGEITPQEAWGLVAKAVRNGLYGSREEFDALPPDVRKIVGSANVLREWAMVDSETLHSVISSNFQRSYKIRQERSRELQTMPSDVKHLICSIAKRMELEPHHGEEDGIGANGEPSASKAKREVT